MEMVCRCLRDLVMGVPSPLPCFRKPHLKTCISSDAKGLCVKLQLGVRALFGVNPCHSFLLPSTAQSLFRFGSLIELHLLGRREDRGGIPTVMPGKLGPATGEELGPQGEARDGGELTKARD